MPPDIENEHELQLLIYGYLVGKYGRKNVKAKLGKRSGPDIILFGNIAIELKYIRSKQDFERGIGQVKGYKQEFDYVILYCYDPDKKLADIDPEDYEEENVKIVIVH